MKPEKRGILSALANAGGLLHRATERQRASLLAKGITAPMIDVLIAIWRDAEEEKARRKKERDEATAARRSAYQARDTTDYWANRPPPDYKQFNEKRDEAARKQREREEQARIWEEQTARAREELKRRAATRKAQRDMAHRIVTLGYRELAKKVHPDIGGDAEQMVTLNHARDALLKNQ